MKSLANGFPPHPFVSGKKSSERGQFLAVEFQASARCDTFRIPAPLKL